MESSYKLPFILQRPFRKGEGACWMAKLPAEFAWACDSNERPRISPFEFWADQLCLGPAHSSHADIASVGQGRFSVWQDNWLYFSTPDNSDPNANGHVYRLDLPTLVNTIRDFSLESVYDALKKSMPAKLPVKIAELNAVMLERVISNVDLVVARFESYREEIEKSGMVFLSIMCSGRTWLRFFLQSYLESTEGSKMSLLPRSIPATGVSPAICFTHDILGVFESIAVAPWVVFESGLCEKPLIYLKRDLRDVAISWFYYMRSSQPALFAEMVPTGRVRDFINSPVFGIERLAAVQQVFMEFFARHPGPKLQLTYEQLHRSPEAEFRKLLGFVATAPLDDESFFLALKKSSFNEMQALEIQISKEGKAAEYMRLGVDNWSGDFNDLKVRSGKIGEFKEIFPELNDPARLAECYPLTKNILDAESVTNYYLEFDLDIEAGSREHFFHFMWGFLLPAVHAMSTLPGEDAKCFWLLSCGPVMDRIIKEAMKLFGVDFAIASDINSLPEDNLVCLPVPRWDIALFREHLLSEDPVEDGTVLSLRSKLALHLKFREQLQQPEFSADTKKAVIGLRKKFLDLCAAKEEMSALDAYSGQHIVLTRSDPPDFYAKGGKAERPGYGTSRRALQNVEEAVMKMQARIPIKSFEPGIHSLKDQIKVFHNCKSIIGIRGAEFANMIWMKPGSKVVMIRPVTMSKISMQRELASMLGLDFIEIDDSQGDYPELDTGLLENLLQEQQ